MGRQDADAVVAAAVVLEHAHPRPAHGEAARQGRVDHVAVGPGRRLADDIAELVVLDDAHDRLGVADGAAVGQEDDAPLQLGDRGGRTQRPAML